MNPEKTPEENEKNKSSGNVPPPIGSPSPKKDFFNYFTAGTRDLIAYILLVIGIILLFFQPIYGGFLIGIVTGAYFSDEINALFKDFQGFIERQGLVRSLILGGVTIAFLISAPAIFLGIAFVVILKFFIFSNDKPA